jgi:hypothetical protein
MKMSSQFQSAPKHAQSSGSLEYPQWQRKASSSTILPIAIFLILGTFGIQNLKAQSLDPNKPAPLQAGLNTGTADNMIGPQYWFLTCGPGAVKIIARFKSMGLLGNATQATITVVLTDEKRTWQSKFALSAQASFNEKVIPGTFKDKQKIVLEVVPPPDGLVRSGGDYQLEATGAVEFTRPENTGIDPIVKTYLGGRGLCKFLADGRVLAADGTEGRWKLFDADSRSYSINYPGFSPESVKLVPGRGLVDAGDGSTLVYTETRK